MSVFKKPASRNPASPQARNAFWSSATLAILHFLFSAALWIVGARLGVQSMLTTAVITLVIAIAASIAVLLSRRGQHTAAIWILIGVIALSIPGISLVTSSLGWVSVFMIPVLFIMIASRTLPDGQKPWAIMTGVASGVVALLMDLFGPARPAFPNAEIIIPFITGSLALIVFILIMRQFNDYALQTKLMLLFLSVALIPLIFLGFLNNRASRNNLIAAASQNLLTTATLTARQLDTFLTDTLNVVQAEAQLPVFQSALSGGSSVAEVFTRVGLIETMIILEQKDPGNIMTYALIDTQGIVLTSFPVGDFPDYMGLPAVVVNSLQVNLLTQTPYVSPILFDENNQASFYFAGVVVSREGRSIGQLLVRYNARILQELMVSNNGLAGQDSFGVLYDQNQMQLAHGTNPDALYTTVAPLTELDLQRLQNSQRMPGGDADRLNQNFPELAGQLRGANEIFSSADAPGGERVNQVAMHALDSLAWKVAFFQPQDVYLVQVDAQTRGTTVLVLVIAAVVAFSSLGASRLLSVPILNLSELVERISSGDLSIQVPLVTRDEIGRLGNAFNRMTLQIRNLLSGLERQVADRTLELERRATQLQAAAEVARDASTSQSLDDLLNNTVDLINERFGFYHAGIFLLDERREYAVLRAANSAGGKQMLARGHKLKVGQVGIVGDTTATGKPHIALEVGEDSAHFAHPLLPDTRAEMALPLVVGDQVIGALDVQSTQPGAFDESDITVLQVLADQLAVAIQNASLLAEYQDTVRELQAAYGQFTQRAWQEWSRLSEQNTGYRSRGAGLEMFNEPTAEIRKAWELGQPVIGNLDPAEAQDATGSSLAVPIRLRDETLGVIQLRMESAEIPVDVAHLIDAIAERLAVALDSARLNFETQRRAAREQITAAISARMRETLDIDSVLQTAAQEIGLRLDLHDVTIQLDLDQK